MPDVHSPGPVPAPPDWNAAFSALPLETPPADGWARVSAALPAASKPSRARYWIPAAIAASLALMMVWPRDPGEHSAPPSVATVSETSPASATAPERAPATVAVAAQTPTGNASAQESDTTEASGPRSIAAQVDTTPVASTPKKQTPESAPRAVEPAPAQTQLAQTQLAQTPSPSTGDAAAAANAGAEANPLESLYAESAQLEALLSQISDDRVASGPAMALSAQLHDRVASIDAALSQPDLAADARLDLWRERVAALQRLTGVEGTQRWMAANGYRADGEVARIY